MGTLASPAEDKTPTGYALTWIGSPIFRTLHGEAPRFTCGAIGIRCRNSSCNVGKPRRAMICRCVSVNRDGYNTWPKDVASIATAHSENVLSIFSAVMRRSCFGALAGVL